jgi:nucleoside-diphosphate-sugar epimerase
VQTSLEPPSSAKRWAIIGAAGAVGRATGAELERRGISFRVLGRRREALETAFGSMSLAEIVPADVSDGAALSDALRGADTAVYAVGLPYTNFAQHPALMAKALEACVESGVRRLVVVSNVYVYGVPNTTPLDETHPLEPCSIKGKMRLEQEEIAFAAHRAGRIQTLVVRPADFYGPGAELSYAHTIFESALAGKPATLLSPADTPHQFTFIPDLAPSLVSLALLDSAYGEAYNIGGPRATVRTFAREVYTQVGAPFKTREYGKTMLRLAGIFDPLMREMVEMHYLQTKPVIASDAKLRAILGDAPETPLKNGIAATLAYLRDRVSREIY